MIAYTKSKLQEKLQEEFCPPLDTTLLAALIADLYLDADPPSQEQIDTLRQTLSLLANQADQDDLAAAFAKDARIIDDDSARSSTLDDSSPASTTTSPTSGYSTASKSTTTRSSPPSEGSSAFGTSDASSPLGFLRAAFPHIPVSRLRRALTDVGYTSPSSSQDDEADGSGVDFDLVGVIEGLLTKEYLKDLEERGLGALEDDVPYVAPETMPAKSPGWDVTQQKKKGKKNKGVKLSLNDVRQQHHIRPTISTGASTSRIKPAPDPWTQLSSLSSHLSSLVPSHQPSFFQSFFHKQGVASDSSALATPAMAIRTALSTIAHTDCKVSASSGEGDHDLNPEATILLFNLTGIIRSNPSFDTLSSSTQSQLFTDALLAIRATNADPGASLDIPWLLCELDQQAEAEWTLSPTTPGYSNGPTSPLVPGKPQQPPSALSKSKYLQQLPSRPPSIPDLRQHAVTKKGKEAKVAPPVNPWSTVPLKKLPPGPNPLAANIPAYNPLNGVSAKKLRKLAANSAGEPSSAGPAATFVLARIDPKEAQKQKRRMDTMDDLKQKRHDAIVRAGRAWMGGNVKNRGGEVAMFYAEQARELQEQVKKEALGAARDKVEGTRVTAENGTTVDLHGTIVSEAVTIAKEILAEHGATPARPLKFITGRGNHSIGRVGVLGPAVRSALVEDGWNVSTWDAGLVVRGRR